MQHGHSKGKGTMRVKDIRFVAAEHHPALPKHEATMQHMGQVIKVSADELFGCLNEEHRQLDHFRKAGQNVNNGKQVVGASNLLIPFSSGPQGVRKIP
eukprot:3940889-Rhodomonas_salina.1